MATIETVRGAINPEKMGITSPHEHVFINCACWIDKSSTLVNNHVTLDIIPELKRKHGQCSENLVLESFEEIVPELERFKFFGGRTLVELTLPGIGRDVKRLREISEATDINIICGTGWYVDSSHPPYVSQSDTNELAARIIAELEDDIDGSGIRAGVIGEIGCSEPLTENERKVIAAAGRAQVSSKAALTLHTALFDIANRRHPHQAPQELDILKANDSDLSKVYVSHMDCTHDDLRYHKMLMDEYGVTLSYDNFGQDQYYDNFFFGAGGFTDRDRIKAMIELLESGYEKQLLMSSDICEKIHTRRYGGWGYSHVLEHIVPELELRGTTRKQLETMMIANPMHLFQRK